MDEKKEKKKVKKKIRRIIEPKERDTNFTYLSEIYERFLNGITTDMYLIVTPNETIRMLQNLFLSAIADFSYPKFPINNYVLLQPQYFSDYEEDEQGEMHVVDKIEDISYYPFGLTNEEIGIIADLMIPRWLGQQLANGDLVNMIYSGVDFKASSQANHISRLNALKLSYSDIAETHMFNYSKSYEGVNGLKYSCFGDINKPNIPVPRKDRDFSFDRYDNSRRCR